MNPEEVNDRVGAKAVRELLMDVYPHAQRAFLQLEVFDHFRSRQLIKRFANTFDLLGDALRNNNRSSLENARSALESLTFDCLYVLCLPSIQAIRKLEQRSRIFWWILFLRNPFKNEQVCSIQNSVMDHYFEGLNDYCYEEHPQAGQKYSQSV